MRQKDADGMENSADPDKTAPKSGLGLRVFNSFEPILRFFTVMFLRNPNQMHPV